MAAYALGYTARNQGGGTPWWTMKLELVAVPVSDVDRAKAFYAEQGRLHADHDHTVSEEIASCSSPRPARPARSRSARASTEGEPGRVQGLQLVVADIEAAHAELVARGVEVSDVQEFPWGRFVFFADPDGNKWALQQLCLVADQPTLSLRALNRATLDRQRLPAAPARCPRGQAIRHLGGLQAQAPLAPYVGLWTRLARFTTDELSALLCERTVVRAPIMRATVHLADTANFVAFRPLFGPLMAAGLRANYARTLTGVDPDALAAQAAGLLVKCPLTRAQLARDLAAAWPAAEPMSLAYAVTYLRPSSRSRRAASGARTAQATWTTAESWLAEPIGQAKPEAVDALVLRYLAAFGPATVADIQTWSGLTRLREVTGRLELRVYRGPDGAELLDLPDKELPAEDVPAPPRFLPEYDNLLLSHADRRRVIPHTHPVPLWPGNGATQGTLLIDGAWDATWKITADALTITPFRRLTAAEESSITAEAAKLLAFTCPADPTRPIRFSPAELIQAGQPIFLSLTWDNSRTNQTSKWS